MRTSRAIGWGGLGLLFLVLLLAGGFYLRPTPGKWEKLADIIDSSGNRLVVAQEHYDIAEGWRVSFTVITPNRRIYGSLLEMETGPWRHVRIAEEHGVVSIWRNDEQVGSLVWSNREFVNFLSHTRESYLDNDVQGKTAPPNFHLD